VAEKNAFSSLCKGLSRAVEMGYRLWMYLCLQSYQLPIYDNARYAMKELTVRAGRFYSSLSREVAIVGLKRVDMLNSTV
jgi:hypothetical protein